ncbi:anti-repressor SinI family protein [Heyndrickxia sporothermodurans]|nr:anti-repressor SinI family protein [Heyndrickxia sporothermodurans]
MTNPLDREWLQLIQQAKHLGLTLQEIREFLQLFLYYGIIRKMA